MQGISFKYIFPAVFQLTSDKQKLIVSYKYSCLPYAICLAKTTESKIKYFLGAKYLPIQGFWNIKQPWSHYQCISLDYFHTGCFCTVRTMRPYRWKSLRGAAECNRRENSFTDSRLLVSTKLWCAKSQAVTQDCQCGSAGRALLPPCTAAGAALEAHSKSEVFSALCWKSTRCSPSRILRESLLPLLRWPLCRPGACQWEKILLAYVG